MDPTNMGLLAIVGSTAQRMATVAGVTQALIVAGITASATGYVSAQVLQREVGYLRESIERLDREQRATAAKVAAVELRQAAAIAERVENQAYQQQQLNDLRARLK